jgi:sirohydrochlorin ferrochelatase
MCQIAPSGLHRARRIAVFPAFLGAGSEFERDLLRNLRRRDRFGDRQLAQALQRFKVVGRAGTERADGGHGFPRIPRKRFGQIPATVSLGSPPSVRVA